jgi:hypothetical protein
MTVGRMLVGKACHQGGSTQSEAARCYEFQALFYRPIQAESNVLFGAWITQRVHRCFDPQSSQSNFLAYKRVRALRLARIRLAQDNRKVSSQIDLRMAVQLHPTIRNLL